MAGTAGLDVRTGDLRIDADCAIATDERDSACGVRRTAAGCGGHLFAASVLARAGFWRRERSLPPESESHRCATGTSVTGDTKPKPLSWICSALAAPNRSGATCRRTPGPPWRA